MQAEEESSLGLKHFSWCLASMSTERQIHVGSTDAGSNPAQSHCNHVTIEGEEGKRNASGERNGNCTL